MPESARRLVYSHNACPLERTVFLVVAIDEINGRAAVPGIFARKPGCFLDEKRGDMKCSPPDVVCFRFLVSLR